MRAACAEVRGNTALHRFLRAVRDVGNKLNADRQPRDAAGLFLATFRGMPTANAEG